MANSFKRDTSGASLVEFTIVFPTIVLVVLGLVDAGLMMFKWSGLRKATYEGARYSVVHDPVASNLTGTTQGSVGSVVGQSCSTSGGVSGACKEIDIYCIAGTGTTGTCYNADGSTSTTYIFQNAAFVAILDRMQSMSPAEPIDRRQVKISYQTTGLGYVGRPIGSPMNVTVSLRCMTTDMFFLSGFLNWALSPPTGCTDITVPAGIQVPPFATTLPSESMKTI